MRVFRLPLQCGRDPELTVATNGLAAEYGHSAGPQITVVSKSGTKNFHGTGFWFHRNEGLNANSWTNNYNGLTRSTYRFTTAGWNLGGPFYIPGKFNRNHDKVFFFVQQEPSPPRAGGISPSWRFCK